MAVSKSLSKSDFKIAQDCPTKLYYKKHGFPTSLDENPYMEMLANGGYAVGLMAQLLYPDGIEITGSTAEAINRTEELLKQNAVTLFEAAIEINGQLIRIDILEKKGNTFNLIEVKSKSFDSVKWAEKKLKGNGYWELAPFKPYLEDVAFQKKVLMEKFPNAEIKGLLFCPDTAKTTELEGMIGWFVIEKDDSSSSGFRKPTVTFIGTEENRNAMRQDHILGLVNVDEWIDPMIPEIARVSDIYLKHVQNDTRIEPQINYKCRDCEFRVTDERHPISGFNICWRALAEPKPHILDLGRLGNINGKKGAKGCIDDLIKKGKTSLHDVPLELLKKDDGTPYYDNRPLYQLTQKEERMDDGFWDAIDNISYPLHFIDFETSTWAIPYHAKMHPYQNVIFQWSCHSINKPGDEPIHTEWLNTVDVYPNIKFAQSLKDQLGDRGTFFQWSKYENTQLKAISHSLDESDANEDKLLDWIKKVAQFDNDDSTLLLDMNKLALKHYFHPLMGGRTSIKVTLPAVLQAYKSQRITLWLKNYGLYQRNEDGSLVDPYKLLPEPSPIYEGKRMKVADGAGAMSAYQDMLYGINRNDELLKKEYADSLKVYCRLDTLAMVIIWEHWMSLRK
ncbi:MAG: DUF2779 domain-containing protein [Bacteroidota bacterium]|nr:DUF2779 domain-containing protein [Bacteroidota bacterium]